MLLTRSAKLDKATFAGMGVNASERGLKSCEEKSRLSSNSSESAGDNGADGMVGAAPQDIADIVEPHGDSGPDQPADKADTININLSVILGTHKSQTHYCY